MNEKRIALLAGLRAAAQSAEGGVSLLIDLAAGEIERLDRQVDQLVKMLRERHHADPVQTALDIAAIIEPNKNGASTDA